MDLQALFVEPVRSAVESMWQQVGAFVPRLVGAVILLLVGLAVAKLIETLVVRALQAIRVDKGADKLQITDKLVRGGVTLSLSELVGAFAYWFVMFLFLIATLNALNLTTAAQLFDRVVAYLPNVVAAMFLMGVAIFFASFLSTAARTAAANAGLHQANFLGQLVQIAILVFAGIIVLEQLQFHVVLLHQALLLLLASIGLGLAISIGLGTKDLVGRMVNDLIERMRSSGRRR